MYLVEPTVYVDGVYFYQLISFFFLIFPYYSYINLLDDARALADAMHARELASVESLETMKKTVTRLEKELDARKRAGDDDA